jgi:hypothetical protein
MMKKLIYPLIAIGFVSCGDSKTEELQAPINPRDTSTVVVCDSLILPDTDSLGRAIREWACDSHFVSRELEEKYDKLVEEYEKVKNAKH